jgi:carbon-monoxide dehydrogenase medium subunit
MKPAPFSYHAPEGVDELLELSAEHAATGRILAGGQSLIPLLNMRRVRVEHLIDLAGVGDLDRIEATDGALVVGALARQARAQSDPAVTEAAPLLAEALVHVASPTIRKRGTVCGSLAFGQPSAELPAAALAIGGEVVAARAGGERRISLDELFVGPFNTSLLPGEVLTELRLRRWPAGAGHAFAEVSRLRLPVVGAAVMVELDGERIVRSSIALAGVAGTPVRATAVEHALEGALPTDAAVAEAAGLATEGLDVPGNLHGSPAYRVHVAEVMVARALGTAVERARA